MEFTAKQLNSLDVNTLRRMVREIKHTLNITGGAINYYTRDQCLKALTATPYPNHPILDKPADIHDYTPSTPTPATPAATAITKEDVIQIVNQVLNPTPTATPTDLYHRDYEKLHAIIKARVNLMMVGPAGSGKSFVASQIARSLNLNYAFEAVGLQTTKSDLLGYMDGNGNYVPTNLYRLYKDGGLFLIDEIDAGNPNVLTVINNMLSNHHAAFPVGMVEKHPDFICIAAANTFGLGADIKYVGRNKMDAATRDRFAYFHFEYDEDLERHIATNSQWTDYVISIRHAVAEVKEKIVVSPRASIQGSIILNTGAFTQDEVEDMFIWRGLDQTAIDRIKERVRVNSHRDSDSDSDNNSN